MKNKILVVIDMQWNFSTARNGHDKAYRTVDNAINSYLNGGFGTLDSLENIVKSLRMEKEDRERF